MHEYSQRAGPASQRGPQPGSQGHVRRMRRGSCHPLARRFGHGNRGVGSSSLCYCLPQHHLEKRATHPITHSHSVAVGSQPGSLAVGWNRSAAVAVRHGRSRNRGHCRYHCCWSLGAGHTSTPELRRVHDHTGDVSAVVDMSLQLSGPGKGAPLLVYPVAWQNRPRRAGLHQRHANTLRATSSLGTSSRHLPVEALQVGAH